MFTDVYSWFVHLFFCQQTSSFSSSICCERRHVGEGCTKTDMLCMTIAGGRVGPQGQECSDVWGDLLFFSCSKWNLHLHEFVWHICFNCTNVFCYTSLLHIRYFLWIEDTPDTCEQTVAVFVWWRLFSSFIVLYIKCHQIVKRNAS